MSDSFPIQNGLKQCLSIIAYQNSFSTCYQSLWNSGGNGIEWNISASGMCWYCKFIGI